MIPNPRPQEQIALAIMEKEIHTLYKMLESKDGTIKILLAALPFFGLFGLVIGWAIGVS